MSELYQQLRQYKKTKDITLFKLREEQVDDN